MPSARYGGFAIALHWLTAVLVVAAFTLGPGGSEARVYSAAKDFERNLHEVLGLTVFALTLVRFAWRAVGPAAPAVEGPRWMVVASKSVQGLLYLLLVAVPLTAIFGAWLSGHPLTLGALGTIGSPVAESHALGRQLAKVHEYLGDTILWVAGFHAAAALFHHFVLRDNVLLSMLPGRRQPLE